MSGLDVKKLTLENAKLRAEYAELEIRYKTLQMKTSSALSSQSSTERNHLRTLLNNLPDSIYIKDTAGRKVITNPVDLELIGVDTESAVIGKTDLEIFPDEKGKRGYADDMAILQTGKALYNHEEAYLDKNGEERWLLTSKVPLYDEQGAISGLLGIGRLITERKKSEEALQQSNERFEYVTRATFDAVWDWDILNDHLYWGEGYEKIFGYKTGSNRDQVHPFDQIHPEDRSRIVDKIEKLIKGTGINWTGEYRYLKASGEYAFVQDKAIVIRDHKGKAVRMIGAMQDTTERKRVEMAVRATQKKFNALVNSIDGIVWEARADNFDFTYVSNHAEKLLGYPTSHWINEPGFWAAHIHPDDREKAVALCKEATRLKKEHQFEYRMIAADGRVVWLADFVSVEVENGEPVNLRGIMVNISEKKIVEEALRAKNVELKRLSSHLQSVREEERKYLAREVHDELGQLASVIKMDIDWLKLRLTDVGDATNKRIDHALSTSDLLLTTIRKMAFALRPVMLDELGLNASLEWQCKEFTTVNGIPCVFEQLCDDTGLTIAVKTELFRICQESLTNIMRHAQATHVIVTIKKINGSKQLTIVDNGIGFDKEKKKNTLGLVGMKERALSLNGLLTVTSEPGKGTTISVTVPK